MQHSNSKSGRAHGCWLFLPMALLAVFNPLTVVAQEEAPIAAPAEPATEPAPEPNTEPAPAETQSVSAETAPLAAGSTPVIPVVPVQAVEEAPLTTAEPGVAQLDEVVVTATKRAKPLREIPASIAALDGAELERNGAQGVEDIAKLVPGVNFVADLGVARITIRGIAAMGATNMTTGTLFGNVSFTDSYLPAVSLDPQLFDLRSVEVLKGPQGTLFGASALNGAVRYVPEQPVFHVFEGRYYAQYASLSEGGAAPNYGAAVNLPFETDDPLALRLVAFDRRTPGFVDNHRLGIDDTNSLKQHGLRGILAWQPEDNIDLSFIYSMQDTDVHDSSVTDNAEGRLSNDNRPRLSPVHTKYHYLGFTGDYGLDWAQLVSESAFVRKQTKNFADLSRAFSNGSVPVASIDISSASDTWSQEVRLVSAEDSESRWQWITGVFFSHQNVRQTLDLAAGPSTVDGTSLNDLLDSILPGLGGFVNDTGKVSLGSLSPDVEIEELALFGDVTRKLGESFELSLGGRLYKTESGGYNVQRGILPLITNLTPEYALAGTVESQDFNPKISLTWHASDNVLAYTTVSRGFRVGGVQAGFTLSVSATPAPDVFESDTIWSYEAGVRTQWLDNTLRVDLVGFYIDWQNPQTLQPDSITGLNYLDNVGGVKSTGADFALQWLLPIPGLMFNTGISYAETVTTAEFRTGSGRVSQPGDPWPFAPEWQTATTLAYTLPFGDWQFSSALTYTTLGESVNSLGELEPIFGYQQWDAQLGLANTSSRWAPEISLALNNFMDERGVINVISQNDDRDVTYIQPRTLIVRVAGRF